MDETEKKYESYTFRAEFPGDVLPYLALLGGNGIEFRDLRIDVTEVSFKSTASLDELIRVARDANQSWHRIAQTVARERDYTGSWLRVTDEDHAELTTYKFRSEDSSATLEYLMALEDAVRDLRFDRANKTTSFRTRTCLNGLRRIATGNAGWSVGWNASWSQIAETLELEEAPIATAV